MGWTFKWVSSADTTFNFDYGVSFTPEERKRGTAVYNFRAGDPGGDEREGVSVFYKDDSRKLFHTYSTYARGIDLLNTAYHYIDLVPKGRDEGSRSQYWVRRRDEYEVRAADKKSRANKTKTRKAKPSLELSLRSCIEAQEEREWARVEIANGTSARPIKQLRKEYAGIILSLAKQESPDTTSYDDEEIVYRVKKSHHAGMIVRSPRPERVDELLNDYAGRFVEDFVAVVPPPERPE
jgi:hypothetical protein